MADLSARSEPSGTAVMSPWVGRVEAELDAVRAADRWRQPRDLAVTSAVSGEVEGRLLTSFASNDYLGLTHHPKVRAAALAAAERWGTGTGASRLVVGSRPLHGELEAALADWKGVDAALLFTSGYTANLGVLTVFGGRDVVVFSDELNHASIIDGCRLARATSRIYRHADLGHLAELLDELDESDGPPIIVSDTVFSMDGDVADLDGLVDLAARYGALLVLDEAHAVMGPDLPALDRVAPGLPVLRVGTLSKTLGSLGGFVAGPQPFIDLLVNAARSFIFTTATTPSDAAAALAALEVLRSPEGDDLVGRLRGHVQRMAARQVSELPSPIVPVVLGDEEVALAAAAGLRERGLLVPAIRPPTVAEGTSRLRVTFSAAHDDGQVTSLLDGLDEVAPGWTTGGQHL